MHLGPNTYLPGKLINSPNTLSQPQSSLATHRNILTIFFIRCESIKHNVISIPGTCETRDRDKHAIANAQAEPLSQLLSNWRVCFLHLGGGGGVAVVSGKHEHVSHNHTHIRAGLIAPNPCSKLVPVVFVFLS